MARGQEARFLVSALLLRPQLLLSDQCFATKHWDRPTLEATVLYHRSDRTLCCKSLLITRVERSTFFYGNSNFINISLYDIVLSETENAGGRPGSPARSHGRPCVIVVKEPHGQ